jgi:hypothetical protein
MKDDRTQPKCSARLPARGGGRGRKNERKQNENHK